MKKVLLVSGGTGGHVFPAQAVAELIIQRHWQCRMVTDDRGLAYCQDMPAMVEKTVISCGSPIGKKGWARLLALLALIKGIWQSFWIIWRYKPNIIVGFGAYPAFPILFIARLLRVPFILHEQNSIVGLVNKLFARHALCLATSFPVVQNIPDGTTTEFIGLPLRHEFLEAGHIVTSSKEGGDIHLLVLGGSQGARTLQEVVSSALLTLPEAIRHRLVVRQQFVSHHPNAHSELQKAYQDHGIRAQISSFIKPMSVALQNADLVISRSGASTVAELACMGCASILVPLPSADGQQSLNADFLAAANASIMIKQDELTVEKLADRLVFLLERQNLLADMAHNAKHCMPVKAGEALIELMERIL